MKWIRMAAVTLLCLCLLTACSQEDGQQSLGQNTISVYYINKAETKITPVEYALEEETLAGQIQEAIDALRENPVELSLRTTVNGYEVLDWEILDTQLIINVNEDYRKIQPTTEVLVRAAIVRTLTQISGIDDVAMTVNGEALTDSLGVTVGPMTADMFIDNAGNEINAYEKVRLNLYFANEEGTRLVKILTQPVVYNSNISLEKLVVEQLIKGPDGEEEGVWPVINPATKVVSVTVKDGICYVNLDDGFMTQLYNVSGDVALYAIVNSLVELSNINKVQIAVNGETNLTFRETFNLANVYERNLDLVYTAEEE